MYAHNWNQRHCSSNTLIHTEEKNCTFLDFEFFLLLLLVFHLKSKQKFRTGIHIYYDLHILNEGKRLLQNKHASWHPLEVSSTSAQH